MHETDGKKRTNDTPRVEGLGEGKDLTNCSNEDIKNATIKSNKDTKAFEEFDVTDGKARSKKEEAVAEAQKLEALLGIKDMNPYKTLNRDVFARNLEEMSVAEMTGLAMRVGVPPAHNRTQLKKQLLKSFEFYAQKHNVAGHSMARPVITKDSQNYESTVRLFKGE